MGGWFSKKKKDDDDDVEEEEEKEYTKIDTGDSTAVKYLLDDKVVEFFREEQKNSVTINYKVDNLKLLLMAFAITVSAGTHFSGVPFPESRYIVIACAAIFFVCNGLLTSFMWWVEKDIILRFSLKDNEKCVVRAQFPKFQEYYTVGIESLVNSSKHVEEKLYVGRFFDEEGHFDEATFKAEIGKLATKFAKDKTT
ncbi:hypothetical protein H310_01489 [Aphanomyces invadans]|uniref:Signal peptidase complex subunit 2 n=1 Tax=Aphanomyces invadans TaxID=157072 RepID=A0A024URV6_9STRA|nr:hypothetical protein H310_01489 [Aphanomyces invadans]ETW09019.1 hypothetical protein H310_01489 [Aphanomyces invadans]|eukprot:XP_008862824.1 hypothetical protein H310_01489 [Aphanomyces invadans]